MNSFFKIAAVDTDARCNNVNPFSYSEMNRKQNAKTGHVFTTDDIKQAWDTFMKITNSTNSRAIPCCNPDIKLSDVNPELLAKVQGIYTYARPIVRNGDLVELQLTKTPKASEAGWAPITPYIICKLSYALQTPGIITKSPDTTDVWVVGKQGLLLDCFPTSCPDSTSIDNLFGTTRKDPEYTYIDDATVARAIKDGDVKYLRDFLFKYNNANQVLTHDDYGNRLVHLAAMHYRPKVFALLVAVKANFNVRNALGNTPLHLAVRQGHMDCIEELVKLSGQTIEVNAKNSRGETPLMMAIGYAPKPDPKTGIVSETQKRLPMTMIRYLYNNGANVLDRDAFGNNMIHIILLNMQPTREMSDAVKFMMNKGVPADQKNNAGITPLMLAADKLKDTGIDNLLPPTQVLDQVTEGFASESNNPMSDNDQKLLPSTTIMAVNQTLNPSMNSSEIQPAININTGPGHGVDEIDHASLTQEQIELMEIRTLLFNDIIRNNPQKYGGFINVSEIPAGAPVEVLDHKCVSASGDILGNNIDTEDQCAQYDGNWTKIDKPSTQVKLELLPESKRLIDAIPDDKLYYPKARPSTDAVPLPATVQDLNASVRSQMPQQPSTTAANGANGVVTEGFHPAAFIAGAAGAAGSYTLGVLADLTSDYISRNMRSEPEIDPDNLTSQRRPNVISRTTKSTSPVKTDIREVTGVPEITAPVAASALALHPPIEPISRIAKEEFTAMKLTAGGAPDITKFITSNWMMLLVFVILAISLITYVSRGLKK